MGNKLAYILLVTILFVPILSGCAPKCEPCQPTIITEYKEVKVPVMYKLSRPNRPMMTDDQPLPVYLNEVLSYIENLEVIIDQTKGSKR